MPFNVMLQICRVTRASKLFQRNFYLPLLKPLSPKDALRRHIITGKNLLGNRIEHYIPVLDEYKQHITKRKYRRYLAWKTKTGKIIKKRVKKKPTMKYVTPFLDDDMEGHLELKELLASKPEGNGQCYIYYVPDKDCTLVIPFQMERLIREKTILDVTIAQRSEKILVLLANDERITLPLAKYDGNAPFYRGEGWTRKPIEELHHHGKETMGLAKLFEAKESGVEEWELEMMRLANKRKRKMKGEGTADWKKLMAAAADLIDWDKFEEEAKQIVEEVQQPVDDEPIPMEVDDMEKTKNVNEKLQNAGPEVLAKLPLVPEIPEIVKIMGDGTFTEIANVSGMSLQLPSSGVERFVAGQMVKSEEGDIFMPGQTLLKEEDGTYEYTPGFTVVMDNEVTLLPGLVMGDDPEKPMFLPGESTITEEGELQFVETEDDVNLRKPPTPSESESEETEEEGEQQQQPQKKEEKKEKEEEIVIRRRKPQPQQKQVVRRRDRVKAKAAPAPPPPPPPVKKEEESTEEVSEEEEEEEVIEIPKPVLPKKPPPKFEYERPKRAVVQTTGIKRREKPSRVEREKKKSAVQMALEAAKSDEPVKPYVPKRARIIDMPIIQPEKDTIQQEKERVKKMRDRKNGEERSINLLRRDIRALAKKLLADVPPAKYVPLEPVKKSEKLIEIETSIKQGTFFNSYKRYIPTTPIILRRRKYDWRTPFSYQNVFNTVGINRYKLWRPVVY